MTAKNTTDATLPSALMGLLRDQGALHSADGASDGSWIVRRARGGPQFVLETPLEAFEYAIEVLVDIRLEAESAR
ncbi:hypothetical protein [Kitasatospora griseola]|uniref:hypothetical protein n=1 Tax=Kitasatospora griseola TaxID=2064 RepID=UPI0038033BB5